MISKRVKENLGAIALFIALVFIANWSLLIGENLMKWDIWDAEYPLQVIMSDAIKSGHLMLWLPLMHYGAPYYAMVGTPVWYPITILIDAFGYGPFSPALEYSIHMVLGGFGMYLFSRYVLKESTSSNSETVEYILALTVGVLYEFTGVFLSNAEHIMIIISAAWIPYALYYAKRYVDSRRILEAMKCGIAAGMIMLGGYPEMFADLFMVMVPCILFWGGSCESKDHKLVRHVFETARNMVVIVACTLMFSAITVIPFVNVMGKITRGGGMTPVTVPFSTIVSTLLPLAINTASDWSMSIFYVGFIVILSIALVPLSRRKDAILYMVFAFISLFLCFGSDSFLHSFIWRFVPMYSTFRFPQLWRTFFALFSLLSVVHVWNELFSKNSDISRNMSRLFKTFTIIAGAMGTLMVFLYYIASDNINLDRIQLIADGCLLLMVVCFLYTVVIYLVRKQIYSTKANIFLFLAVVVFEVLVVDYKVFPTTVASYEPIAYNRGYDRNGNADKAKEKVTTEKGLYDNRIVDCDFSNSMRSRSGINSKLIAFDKSLDEEGYLSVKLESTETYKASYNRSIIQQNPEAYFTNDIVNSDSLSLEEWRAEPDVSEYQVFTDDVCVDVDEDKIVSGETVVKKEKELDVFNENGVIFVEGNFQNKSQSICKLRLYFSGSTNNGNVCLGLKFLDENGNESAFNGNYKISGDGNNYIDISLPSVSALYKRVSFEGAEMPVKASIIRVERNTSDRNTKIDGFTFNAINIKVNAPTDGIVTVLQAKYPGWNAYVDGVKTDIAEIDGCFIGVPVTEGEHKIELRFRPIDFYVGVAVSLAFCMLFCWLFIRDKKILFHEDQFGRKESANRKEVT